jgi:hypothetical protein
MKKYSQVLSEALQAEGNALLEEAQNDPAKMEMLLFMLDEDAGVANTASGAGLAGVSTGEIPPIKSRTKTPMWRRKNPLTQ